MDIRRHFIGCAALVLVAGCGSTADMPPSTDEHFPPTSTPVRTNAPGASHSEASETPSVETPPYEPPSPSDITTVASVQLAENPQGPVDDDLERLITAWVTYAMGEAGTFPHWESISMAVGGQTVVAFDDVSAALSNRDIWKQCPADWDIYGASSCPVDILGPVRSSVVNDAVLIYSSTLEEVTCAPVRTNPLPQGRMVVLRPVSGGRTCATDFAIALVADPQGRLRHVDITLSAP